MATKQASLFDFGAPQAANDLGNVTPSAPKNELDSEEPLIANSPLPNAEIEEAQPKFVTEEVIKTIDAVVPEDNKENVAGSDEELLVENYTSADYIFEEPGNEVVILENFIAVVNAEESKPSKYSGERKSTRGRMKISDMGALSELPDIPDDASLFEKRYYSIGAVSEMFRVNISLIRFWENEFDILKPKKNGKGDRFFRPEDVKNLQLIYHLLREKKYTIEGAKDFLKKNNKADETFRIIEGLKKIKSFLYELKAHL